LRGGPYPQALMAAGARSVSFGWKRHKPGCCSWRTATGWPVDLREEPRPPAAFSTHGDPPLYSFFIPLGLKTRGAAKPTLGYISTYLRSSLATDAMYLPAKLGTFYTHVTGCCLLPSPDFLYVQKFLQL